jgi:hypothetical protein
VSSAHRQQIIYIYNTRILADTVMLTSLDCHSSFFFGGTQGFAHAKQVLYRLSPSSSPFCSGYFRDGVFQTLCLAGLKH